MDTKECSVRYHELVANIEAAQIYDGRNKGIDVYVCDKCGAMYHTRYKDKGVTPFTIHCRECNKGTMVHKTTLPDFADKILGISNEIHNWVRPSFEQFMKLDEGAREHVLQGGLILEDELISDDKKVDADKIFHEIQEMLDSLQDSGESCMFITGKHHFVLSGNPVDIKAELIIAMMRYPVIKEIIDSCSQKFDQIKAECGAEIEKIKMDHLIEKYSEH